MSAAQPSSEPRALAAALAAPAFVPRGGTMAMARAGQHMTRFAPEDAGTHSRSMKSVAFADRIISPLFSAAANIGGLRLFSSYQTGGFSQRQVANGGWLFPKPWYEDELRWLAAARLQSSAQAAQSGSSQASQTPSGNHAVSFALPSLSTISSDNARQSGVHDSDVMSAWSPFASLAQTAHLQTLTRVMQATRAANANTATGDVSVARQVMSQWATQATQLSPLSQPQIPESRWVAMVPAMTTPPAPRGRSAQLGQSPSLQSNTIDGTLPSVQTRGATSAQVHQVEQLAVQRALVQQQVAALQLQLAAEQQSAMAAATMSEQRTMVDAAPMELGQLPQPELRAERQARAKAMARRDAVLPMAQLESNSAAGRIDAVAKAEQRKQWEQQVATLTAVQEQMRFAQLVAALPASTAVAMTAAPAGEQRELPRYSSAEMMASAPLVGPRVVMPSGLGAIAGALSSRAAMQQMTQMAAASQSETAAMRSTDEKSVFLAADMPAMNAMPMGNNSLLATLSNATPRALAHLAWSDRWLGQIAGASAAQLTSFDRTASAQRFAASSLATPLTMVARRAVQLRGNTPMGTLDVEPGYQDVRSSIAEPISSPGISSATMPARDNDRASSALPMSLPYRGVSDDDETSDDMFEQIASAAAAVRSGRAAASSSSSTPALPSSSISLESVGFQQASAAQSTQAAMTAKPALLSGPALPGAGLAASLSASPFLAALAAVGRISASSASIGSFDVRALFSDSLVSMLSTGDLAIPFEPTFVWFGQ